MGEQDWQTDAICKAKESTIRDTTSSASILGTTFGHLNRIGLKLNEYDKCVTNKTIKGKQCTIIWHVDDLKISHVDHTIVSDIIGILNKKIWTREPPCDITGQNTRVSWVVY